MKLSICFLVTLFPQTAEANKAIREIRKSNPDLLTCGKTYLSSTRNTTVHTNISLKSDQDACVYKIKGSKKKIIEVLDFQLGLNCDDGEVILFAGDEQYGPYCNGEKRRRRRNAYGYSYHDLQGQRFKSNELDMIFTRNAGLYSSINGSPHIKRYGKFQRNSYGSSSYGRRNYPGTSHSSNWSQYNKSNRQLQFGFDLVLEGC